jgi:hypothetical protein
LMSTSSEVTQGEPGEPELGSQEDWEIIEAALGFKGFDPQRREALHRQLQTTVKLYYPRLGKRRHELRPAHFQTALGVLRNHADRLRCYLGAAEPWPTDELSEWDDLALGVFLCDHYLMVPRCKRNALLARPSELIGLIDHGLQSLSGDKGWRPRNEPLQLLICHLADFYRQSTGKRPGISWNVYDQQSGGPFLRFVSRALKVFAPDQVKDDNALGADIKRVLQWWRKTPLGMDKTRASKD